ncbi:hypothetical protein FIC_01097 [Flavobacteriaceae bacterium 3519-10]|nr:hypothetical protein FIC_01097 [Flavobacteriaceae bacterium 3519-10]
MDEHIENKIEYWQDLWHHLIDNFLKKSYGLNLYNVHILLEDIIVEIEENNFRNDENRKFFKGKLDEYFSTDKTLSELFYSDFKYLCRIFHEPNKNNLIYTISKDILTKFQKGLYFTKCLENLIEILFNHLSLGDTLKEINYYTQNIIIEFIKKGYVLKDIKKFTDKIFDNYQIINNGEEDILVTTYPHNISYSDYKVDGQIDRENLNLAISNVISNLTLKDRIQEFINIYNKEREEAYYIFVIQGLRGDQGFEIGDIAFYSPSQKRFAVNDNFDDEELQSDKDDKYIQAAVKVDFLASESSLAIAISKLQNAINLLHTYYDTKIEIEIITSKYLVIKDGIIINTSWSNNNNDFIKLHKSLRINRLHKRLAELDKYKILFSSQSDETASTLLNAIHWYSKGENSLKPEDKLLNYWISIENIINSEFENIKNDIQTKNKKKIEIIQSIVSSNYIFNFIYEFGWEYYNHYSVIAHNKLFNKTGLPDNLIEKANLVTKEGEPIYLQKFVESLPEIKDFETNLFLKEKIENLIDFYNNNNYSATIIKQQIKSVEDDLLMTYRYRNLIVHNAHFDNAMLPYYIWKIKDYSGNLIRNLLYRFEKTDDNLSTLLFNIYIEKEKFLIDLKDNKAKLFMDK